MSRTLARALAVLVSLTLVAAACTDDGDGASTGGTTGETTGGTGGEATGT